MPYDFLESTTSKCRSNIENEEQFEKHYRAMSVKIVTWAYVSYRGLTLSLLRATTVALRKMILTYYGRLQSLCVRCHWHTTGGYSCSA